jgi:PadR family transcriptional regulator, regulatory protein AphA
MELPVTAYALLGLLSLRPWTTYELAQQAQRSLRLMWPVAERQLYEQPKLLVRHGLASVRKEATGARPRTVYDITPAGRQALRDWLATTDGTLQIRSELLLRVFFAEQGTKTDLLAHVQALRGQMEHAWERQVALYEADRAAGMVGGPFPDRRHVNALGTAFLFELSGAVQRWSDWVVQVTADWAEELDVPESADRLLEAVFGLRHDDDGHLPDPAHLASGPGQ